MGETIEWYKARLTSNISKMARKMIKFRPNRSVYAGRQLLNVEDGALVIKQMIESDKPCMICRYGSVELDTLTAAIAYPDIARRPFESCLKKGYIFNNAGFFPREKEQVLKFADMMKTSSTEADYIGVWFNPMEDYIVEKYARRDTKIGILRSLEPWYSTKTRWTQALSGKKILVIHPFAETIKSQYKRRELLFPGTNILPQFELFTQKAVQTAVYEKDSRFRTWFEALDFMYDEAMKVDFDVAILGCGAYGFPLAAKLKRTGKKAVHMGGSTQILFGIKGGRWDKHPVISGLYNDAWVRPSVSERPDQANKVENACYW